MAAVLRTAVPSTLLTALNDPAVASSLSREFALSSYPSWYTPLPSDVKNYINSAANVTDDQSLSSSSITTTTTTSSSANASTSALLRTSASSVISAASASETSASQTSSTSTGGAPAPTDAILASMAGVVGVLALAVGL